MRRLQYRAAGGIMCRVFLRRYRRAGLDVVAKALADIGRGAEHVVRVEPLGAVGMLVVAGPLDARPARELLIGDAAVIAQPALRAHAPVVESALGIAPLDERGTVLVAQVHAL